jgi:hypothetical protein
MLCSVNSYIKLFYLHPSTTQPLITSTVIISTMKNIFHVFKRNSMMSDSMSSMTEQPLMMPETMPMPMASESKALTVVELFQSQGCNSCPPSSDNIIALSADPDLLVLTYQVTYWDSLGWTDTFGNLAFDTRQWEYAHGLKNTKVYTPQVPSDFPFILVGLTLTGGQFKVIVNGRVDGVGNRMHDLKSLIAKGTAAHSANVVIHDGKATVSGPEGASGLVQLVRYDPRVQDVAIHRGENRGSTLPHKNVVTDVMLLGKWSGGEQTFRLPMIAGGGEKLAILVQSGTGGVILGADRLEGKLQME